ncbi:hypothetical protein O3P69_003316 [Scylla paramamosain]|uniref:Uncharacterized protein n=1 Tax=Scylla paramamosain TaxID=85552 RepID=A0AAW0UL13_SCYPA
MMVVEMVNVQCDLVEDSVNRLRGRVWLEEIMLLSSPLPLAPPPPPNFPPPSSRAKEIRDNNAEEGISSPRVPPLFSLLFCDEWCFTTLTVATLLI